MGQHLADNILLTGIPRSGTTLCCTLLNQCDNTLALHEPIAPEAFKGVSDQASGWRVIEDFLKNTRSNVLNHGRAPTKHLNGRIPANPVGNNLSGAGLRNEIVELGTIDVEKPLNAEFTLVVKHNALFTALLGKLKLKVKCFAVIRNPLAVLASWQTVDLPINQGRIPMAEQFDPELSRKLQYIPDRIERQLAILIWFFRTYSRLGRDQILRYEDLVETNGSCLQTLMGKVVSVKLENRNLTTAIDHSLLASLHAGLSKCCDSFYPFYSREDIDTLLHQHLKT